MSWLIVRVRSDVKVERSIKETMHFLNLTKVNHATIVPERPQYAGMLQKAKDYITWGEVSTDMIEKILRERGRLTGDSPLTDAYVSENSSYKGIGDFAAAISSGETTVKDMAELKRVLRLSPQSGTKGWGGIKRAYSVGGALGFRGEEISSLAERMI